MPKRKHNNQISFLDSLADANQAKGFLPKDAQADARAFATEQKRKSKRNKHVPLAKAPASGPACLRCVHWRPPAQDEEFGQCRYLVKTLDDAPWMNVPKGTIVDRETARGTLKVVHENLLTGEAFRCSAYHMARDLEAA